MDPQQTPTDSRPKPPDPETSEKIQAIYAEARRAQDLGQDDEALKKYAAVIELHPRIPEAHFQIARLFLNNDRPERALRHVAAAASLRPRVPEIWKLWSEIIMVLSDKDEQRIFVDNVSRSPLSKRDKSAITTSVALTGKSDAKMDRALLGAFDAIVADVNNGNPQSAEARARAELKRFPKIGALHDILALALLDQGRKEEAQDACQAAIRLDPEFATARVTYARVLDALQRAPEAVHQCNIALRQAPGLVTALIARALAYRSMGYDQQAMDDYRRAIALDPKNDRAYHSLIRMLLEDRNLFEARDVIAAARKKGVNGIGIDLQEGTLLADLAQTEEALKRFQKVIEYDPDNALGYARCAELLQTVGEFDKAEEYFKRAVELDPDRGETYRVYLMTKKIGLDDPIVAHMEGRFSDTTLSPERRANFGFAIGKVHEDNKDYDRVFEYLHPSNKLLWEATPYNIERREELDHRLMESFREFDWQSSPVNEASDFRPIFVTGMPRSGTTLVEQIIASHSDVADGGEVGVIGKDLLRNLGNEAGTILPIDQLPLERFAGVGERYERFMRELLGEAKRYTDKTIQTYQYVGPIMRAMPKSRIVIVRRDPRDNLLSIYKNIFPDGAHTYSYNLSVLVRVYRLFVEFVELWRELTPDWIYEIQYEDLVANPAEEARKLIAACDLEWEDQCLDFHKSDRRVKTLSLYQVRQPIYKSSAKAWERYRDDLGELFEALGPEYSDAAE